MSNIKHMITEAKDIAYSTLSEGKGTIAAESDVFDMIWAHTGMEDDANESSRDMAKNIVAEVSVESRFRSRRWLCDTCEDTRRLEVYTDGSKCYVAEGEWAECEDCPKCAECNELIVEFKRQEIKIVDGELYCPLCDNKPTRG